MGIASGSVDHNEFMNWSDIGHRTDTGQTADVTYVARP